MTLSIFILDKECKQAYLRNVLSIVDVIVVSAVSPSQAELLLQQFWLRICFPNLTCV